MTIFTLSMGSSDKIKYMRRLAEKRGGKCLSLVYKNSVTKLKWQCVKGHQWEALPGNIKQGTWCPNCSGKLKLTIEEMQLLANKHSGKCLSDTYNDIHTKLLWQCKLDHQWAATPASIKQGSWCPTCATSGPSAKKTLADMQTIAGNRNGKCLSTSYEGTANKLLWQCAKGHQWKATPSSIKQGSWCPKCAGNRRYTIEHMRIIAKERGGNCLSISYKNNSTKLLWVCSEGHRWEAMPMKIISGTWCRKCSRTKQRK